MTWMQEGWVSRLTTFPVFNQLKCECGVWRGYNALSIQVITYVLPVLFRYPLASSVDLLSLPWCKRGHMASVANTLSFLLIFQDSTNKIMPWASYPDAPGLCYLYLGKICGVWLSLGTKTLWLSLRKTWWRLFSKGMPTLAFRMKVVTLHSTLTSTVLGTLLICKLCHLWYWCQKLWIKG